MSGADELCRAWGTLRGCRFGEDCKYKHSGPQGDAARARVSAKGAPEPCKGWSSERGCRYGDKCPYQHSGPGKLFVEKSDAEKAKEPCNNWKSTKGCSAGDNCKYLHVGATGKVDRPASSGAARAPRTGGAEGEARRPRRRGGRGSGGAGADSGATRQAVAKKPVEKVDEECNNWKSDKGCWKGADCKYKHVGATGNPNPEEPQRRRGGRGGARTGGAAPAADGAPKKCRFFNTADGCKSGRDCKFSHE